METISNNTAHTASEDKILQIRKEKHRRLKRVVFSLLGLVIFFFLTTVYSQYQVYVARKLATAEELNNPEVPTTPNQIVEAVARHILLPDTVPQIASIQDAQKLSKTQTFFKNAINGDVVLVYETMIIVYRPAQDLLVAVGDVVGTEK